MANKKISDLAANTTPATTALVEVEDASASGKTTLSELLAAMGGGTGDVTEADFGLYRRVRVATSLYDANIVIATALDDGSTVDSVTIATGDVVLLCAQTTASENGFWVVAASGAPSRPTWFPAGGSAFGTLAIVEEGTQLATRRFECTNLAASDTIDTNDLVFELIAKHHTEGGAGAPDDTSEGFNDGYFPGDTYSPNNQENQAWFATNADAGTLLWTEITGYREIEETTTARTLSDSDIGATIFCSNAADCVITINTGLAAGIIRLIAIGTGQIHVNAGTATRAIAATFDLGSTSAKTAERYSPMVIISRPNVAYITGDLEPV